MTTNDKNLLLLALITSEVKTAAPKATIKKKIIRLLSKREFASKVKTKKARSSTIRNKS
jgi:hypothetical protein